MEGNMNCINAFGSIITAFATVILSYITYKYMVLLRTQMINSNRVDFFIELKWLGIDEYTSSTYLIIFKNTGKGKAVIVEIGIEITGHPEWRHLIPENAVIFPLQFGLMILRERVAQNVLFGNVEYKITIVYKDDNGETSTKELPLRFEVPPRWYNGRTWLTINQTMAERDTNRATLVEIRPINSLFVEFTAPHDTWQPPPQN
jgi:hypothetical protein